MAGRPKGKDVQLFTHMTEALRRGRRRIKAQYVPELVAWLLVHSYQYERILGQFRSLATSPTDPVLKGNGEYARHALSVIQTLINTIYEGFNRQDWLRATEEVERNLEMQPDKELPDVIHNLEANPLNLHSEV